MHARNLFKIINFKLFNFINIIDGDKPRLATHPYFLTIIDAVGRTIDNSLIVSSELWIGACKSDP